LKIISVIHCVFFHCVRLGSCSSKVVANGLQICDGRDFQHKCSIEFLILKLKQMFHRSTSAAILPNRCCVKPFAIIITYVSCIKSPLTSQFTNALLTKDSVMNSELSKFPIEQNPWSAANAKLP